MTGVWVGYFGSLERRVLRPEVALEDLSVSQFSLFISRQTTIFMDPWKVIKHYSSCPIHPLKSKIESLSLGSVHKFLFDGEEIEGAHMIVWLIVKLNLTS
jgi:hypothetical protein